jgi:hypothetical protein
MPSQAGLPGLPRETDLRMLKIQRDEIESARSDTVYIRSSALFFRSTRAEAIELNEAATVQLVNSLPPSSGERRGAAGQQHHGPHG